MGWLVEKGKEVPGWILTWGVEQITRHPVEAFIYGTALANPATRRAAIQLGWLVGKETIQSTIRISGGAARIIGREIGSKVVTGVVVAAASPVVQFVGAAVVIVTVGVYATHETNEMLFENDSSDHKGTATEVRIGFWSQVFSGGLVSV